MFIRYFKVKEEKYLTNGVCGDKILLSIDAVLSITLYE